MNEILFNSGYCQCRGLIVVYLMIDTYNYNINIIPMDKWSYSFIYFLIPQIIFFYQLIIHTIVC